MCHNSGGYPAPGEARLVTRTGNADDARVELEDWRRQRRNRPLRRLPRTTSAPSGQTKVAQTTALSYTYTGLACDADYSLALVAVDAAGNKSILAEAIWYPVRTLACESPAPPSPPSDAQPPTSPAGLSVASTTGTGVTINWAASADNVAVSGYGIYREASLLSTTTSTSTTHTGLTCGTAYTLGVDAYDRAGNRSTRSNVTATTSPCPDTQAPTKPTNVVAGTRTGTSIALNWAASTDNVGVTGYGLYRGGSLVGTTAGATGIFSDLTCGTSYTLAVDARDAAGNRSQQAVLMVSTADCASPPSNILYVSTTAPIRALLRLPLHAER